MSVKIRCSECRKKISVDEAFAGSMCRCPYCKSIVIVPKGIGEVSAAPGRPARPSAPPGGSRPKAPTRPGKGLAGSGLRNVVGSRPIISGQQVAPPKTSDMARPLITETSKPAASEKEAQDALKALQEAGKQEPASPKPVEPKPVPVKPVEPKSAETPAEPKPVEPKSAETPAEPKPVEPKPAETPAEPKPVEKPVEPKPAEPTPAAASEPEEEEVLETIHVDVSELTPEQLAAIPTANPVVVQGVMALILMGVLVVMLALVIFLGIKMFGKNNENADDINSIYSSNAEVVQENKEEEKLLKNPFVSQEKPMIGGRVLTAPVAFVIDGSAQMAEGGVFEFASQMAQASIKSMGGEKFALYVARDPDVETVTGMRTAGVEGVNAIAATLADLTLVVGGVTDVEKAVEKALTQKPATVVLLISRKPLANPKALGEKVKAAGAVLDVVALGSRSGMDETYQQAAKAGGGKVLIYGINELQEYHDEK